MPTYQKKALRIQAFKLGKKGEPTPAPEWFLPNKDQITDEGIEITTLEGVMLAQWGDYIIQSIKGEIYPCKPDIFEASYDFVIEPTKNDPFGLGEQDQIQLVFNGIQNLCYVIAALPNGREKSIMMTKVDELRHWNGDLHMKREIESEEG